ncbi:NAD-dependent epimerase/dehydratase family protein [Nocardia farcinica]|nr:NAD-dependent epimerase/dehydratase family protein [Nocardia farcinica]
MPFRSIRSEVSTRVLVTGGNGYVAGHVIEELVANGYSVRASVRESTDHATCEHVRRLAAAAGADLELVYADLSVDRGWDQAVADCEYVLHIASPVPMKHQPRSMVTGAVDGTLRVLNAAQRSPTVRRVVLTSSTLAVAGRPPREGVLTEDDWSTEDSLDPYALGKLRAERAAWEFLRDVPARRCLELSTILPGNVLGPLQRPAHVTSHTVIRRLLSGSVPGLLRTGWPIVDVRDLAIAHRRAMELPAAAGKRYICAGPHVWMSEIAAILDDEFGPQGYRMPRRVLPDWAVRLGAHVDRGLELAVPSLGRPSHLAGRRLEQDLGLSLRPTRDSIIETAQSLIEFGVVGNAPRRQSFIGGRMHSTLRA